MLRSENVELSFTEEAIREIAKITYEVSREISILYIVEKPLLIYYYTTDK